MKFFNFQKKHWVIVGIFLIFNILMVIGFTVFVTRLHNKVRLEVQRSLVPPPFRMTAEEEKKEAEVLLTAEEKKKETEVLLTDGALTVESDTCTACEAKRKEMEGKSKKLNYGEVNK